MPTYEVGSGVLGGLAALASLDLSREHAAATIQRAVKRVLVRIFIQVGEFFGNATNLLLVQALRV
jgi:hypothetical protein